MSKAYVCVSKEYEKQYRQNAHCYTYVFSGVACKYFWRPITSPCCHWYEIWHVISSSSIRYHMKYEYNCTVAWKEEQDTHTASGVLHHCGNSYYIKRHKMHICKIRKVMEGQLMSAAKPAVNSRALGTQYQILLATSPFSVSVTNSITITIYYCYSIRFTR
jgi:hypothetical protein